MADFTLFRGRVMKPKVDNLGAGVARVTLECQDYNGLWDKIAVGAPVGEDGPYVTQDDGTKLYIDAAAIAGPMIQLLESYWIPNAPIAEIGPDIDDTFIIAPDVLGEPLIQWHTALTNLRAALDECAAHVSGAVRYWIDPDLRPHWRETLSTDIVTGIGGSGSLIEFIEEQYGLGFPVPDPEGIVMAPYQIGPLADPDTDPPTIMAKNTGIEWDYSYARLRAYIRGSTMPGSGWAPDGAVTPYFRGGEEYIDAPGSIYEEDKNAIGRWHGRHNLRDFALGSADISPGYDGWRVGMILMLTDPVLSLFSGGTNSYRYEGSTRHAIENRPFTIQQVTGTLKAGGAPIGVRIGPADVTAMVSKMSFTWTETLGEAGRASVVLELEDVIQGLSLPTPTEFAIPPVADIELWIPDGTAPLIEYEVSFGDIPPGALSRQLAKVEEPEPPAVIYHFNVTWDDPLLPDGASCRVTAQLADAGNAAVQQGEVPLEWVLIQWSDEAGTVPGTGYSLDDDVGTTDASGKAFTTLNLSGGDSIKFEIYALALPID